MRCGICSATLMPEQSRVVLCDEIQQIVWGKAGGEPEVEIAGALWLAFYCPGKCADAGLDYYLSMVDAEKMAAEVRPVEECSICGKEFKTSAPHHTVALSIESGDEDSPLVNDEETQYPARFCPSCIPADQDFGRYRTD